MDWLCAIKELEILGVPLNRQRVEQLKKTVENRNRRKERTRIEKKRRAQEEVWEYSDATFAYIAGYTPAGFAYGITWEEIGEMPNDLYDEEDSDIPF